MLWRVVIGTGRGRGCGIEGCLRFSGESEDMAVEGSGMSYEEHPGWRRVGALRMERADSGWFIPHGWR